MKKISLYLARIALFAFSLTYELFWDTRMRRRPMKKWIAMLFLAGFSLSSQFASAREITDWEARKLTLAALTSVPTHHRFAAKRKHHSSSYRLESLRHKNLHTRRLLIRTVAYRSKAPHRVGVRHTHRRHRG